MKLAVRIEIPLRQTASHPFGPLACRISLAQYRGLVSSRYLDQCKTWLPVKTCASLNLSALFLLLLRSSPPCRLGRCRLTHTRLGLKAQGLYLPEGERCTPVLQALTCNTFQGTALMHPEKGAVQVQSHWNNRTQPSCGNENKSPVLDKAGVSRTEEHLLFLCWVAWAA